MAEERALTTEEKLDLLIRTMEKIDKAQNLALVSKYLQATIMYTLTPGAEKVVRKFVEETRKELERG